MVYRETFEPPHDKTNKMACASSNDSDQPGQRRLWSGWSESLLGAHTILLEMSCGSSFSCLLEHLISRKWVLVLSSAAKAQRKIFLLLHINLVVVWAIIAMDPSSEIIDPRHLIELSTASSLWHGSHWGCFVIAFALSGPIFILYSVVVVSRRLIVVRDNFKIICLLIKIICAAILRM